MGELGGTSRIREKHLSIWRIIEGEIDPGAVLLALISSVSVGTASLNLQSKGRLQVNFQCLRSDAVEAVAIMKHRKRRSCIRADKGTEHKEIGGGLLFYAALNRSRFPSGYG